MNTATAWRVTPAGRPLIDRRRRSRVARNVVLIKEYLESLGVPAGLRSFAFVTAPTEQKKSFVFTLQICHNDRLLVMLHDKCQKLCDIMRMPFGTVKLQRKVNPVLLEVHHALTTLRYAASSELAIACRF